MSGHGHDLHSDFSADAEWLQRLTVEGAEVHALASLIHRIESGSEQSSATRPEALKRARLAILDDVAAFVPVRKAA